VLTDQPAHIEKAMQEYGKHLGTAFQLIDDVLDYVANEQDMGKKAGDDLAEGKPTLPLLHAMWNAPPKNAQLIKSAIENSDGMANFDAILAIMHQTGSIEYTQNKAIQEANMAKAALSVIPDSEYKEALLGLAELSVNRSS
jgi:octaprenyl-diphosphate synthase